MSMQPLTEHRLVYGPVVYGYLRLTKTAAAWRAALAETLAEYCRQHELRLSGVFTERPATTEIRTAAFTGLLDVLALPETYGVVLPAISHLGPRAMADQREKQIIAAGARLLPVRPARPSRPPGRRPWPLPQTGP
jgi:hypothetical protein